MPTSQPPLELWGGVECTINRVHDLFFDQLELSGHRERVAADLQLVRDLGLQTMRTPILWEHLEATQSWEFPDLLLAHMERLGIRPIVGLLHHGSGPPSTSLLDPAFPEKLAAFALKVAQRYPHVLDYTPVNEPHTTARFSALYGFWYPHERSIVSYLRALLHEIKATVLAMRAVRTVQLDARLIYTEDGGTFFSTPELRSFCIEREHRRWLGTDLLTGRVVGTHPLFSYLLGHGIDEEEILWFAANPCPPSILGLNYYVTSDRFLDHRLHLYPSHLAGGDEGSEPLVDFEAIRIRPEGIAGVQTLLTEAWQRYGIPVAITEAHLGAEPAEQRRWLREVWQHSQAARLTGVDVRAVTVWALLGSSNWCNLCTSDTGTYEPGVFDLSSGVPVPTPLASLVSELAHGDADLLPPDQTLDSPAHGWWHQPSRIVMHPSGDNPPPEEPDSLMTRPNGHPDQQPAPQVLTC